MKSVIFTATFRPGGLDVLEASLMRQINKDFVWAVTDELLHEREDVWDEISNRNDFHIVFIEVEKQKNKRRNLAAAYNQAREFAIDYNFDLFISLQDYLWINEHGVERFVWLHKEKANDLLTGVTHISKDPYPPSINDLQGKYSLWDKPFTEKPKRIGWLDSRIEDIYRGFQEGAIITVDPEHWEANWSAVPVELLKDGLKWNEDYDYGVAYENMDFAKRAQKEYGSNCLLDSGNIAISLPHKEYFKGEEQEIIDYSNRELFEKEWM